MVLAGLCSFWRLQENLFSCSLFSFQRLPTFLGFCLLSPSSQSTVQHLPISPFFSLYFSSGQFSYTSCFLFLILLLYRFMFKLLRSNVYFLFSLLIHEYIPNHDALNYFFLHFFFLFLFIMKTDNLFSRFTRKLSFAFQSSVQNNLFVSISAFLESPLSLYSP